MIIHYVKIALRNIWKYKFQNVVAILGVAIGLVCFTICCYIPRFYMDLGHDIPDLDRICLINGNGTMSPVEIKQMLASEFPADIQDMTFLIQPVSYPVQVDFGNNKKVNHEICLIESDTSVTSFYSLKFVKGNDQMMKKSSNSIVLFENYAKKLGDINSLLGKEIYCQGKIFYLNGILKDLPATSYFSPMKINGFIFQPDGYKLDSMYWDVIPVATKLRKGMEIPEFKAKFDSFLKTKNETIKLTLSVSKNNLLNNKELRTKISIILVFGFLILMIGLLNYLSFLIAQFYNRIGEYTIRKINGAGMIDSFKLIFIEFLFIWLFVAFSSFFILDFFRPYFYLLKLDFLILDLKLIQTQLIQYILIGILCIVFISAFFAIYLEKLIIKSSLVGVVAKSRKMNARNIILFIQMIIFLGFISSALLIKGQVTDSYSKFYPSLSEKEKDDIMTIRCEQKLLRDKKDVLLDQIKSSSSVREATYTYSRIFTFTPFEPKINLELSGLEDVTVGEEAVSPDFSSFFNLKLISGKFFTDESNPQFAVVNQKFAELYPDKNPVGKSFSSGDKRFLITGVIENVETGGKWKELPMYYIPVDDWKKLGYTIYVKPMQGKEKEARQHIESCFRKFLPETSDFELESLSESIKSNYSFKDDFMLQKTINLFSTISLLICLLSLYSSVTLNTEQRRKEVAIRKINGAGVIEIIYLFAKNYIYLLTAACIIAFPIVYYFINQWLEKFTQRISLNWIIFLLIYLGALVIVLATIIFRILKVARENPAEVIKSE